jgi:hypothetical protein
LRRWFVVMQEPVLFAGVDDMKLWNFLTLPGLELFDSSVIQPAASRYTDNATVAHKASLKYAELSAWPARTNSSWTIPLI